MYPNTKLIVTAEYQFLIVSLKKFAPHFTPLGRLWFQLLIVSLKTI